jgi:tetratricopeptide (TPR) repeat protein
MLRNRLSAFTPLQRRLFVVTFVSGALTVLNALYLVIASHVFGTGRDPEVLPVTYQFMLVLHVCGGILACVAAMAFVATHVPRMIRSRRWMMRESGFLLPVLWMLLLASGLFILTEANSRENIWMFVAHQVAAVLLLFAYFAHRRLSRSSPTISSAMRAGLVAAAVLVAVGAVHFAETGGVRVELSATADAASAVDTAAQPARSDDIVPAALSPFRAPGDPDPDSPLYPSKTTTTTGGYLPSRILTHDDIPDLEKFSAQTREHGFAPDYFLGAQTCQRCHADVVEQWATSAHRFASFNNPFYRRSVELTREKTGRKPSKFCGGCHDPAVMLAGNMEKDIDPLTPESQAGLTCLACHAIDAIHDRTGNGNYNIHDRTESPYLFDLSKHGLARTVHDYVLKAKPTAHKQRMLKPFFRDSEFCLTCHKVNLDVPVNNYRWVRGQNDYDAWHNSGFARNNPATWYEPPAVKTCQDCHMAPEPAAHGDVSSKGGMVRSHRFLAVNTALPAIRGDQETIRRIEEFLRDDKLRIDLFALRREDGTLIYPLDRQQASVRPGEVVQVEVVVRNLGVGHTFPGGTNDSNEGWIDFSARVDGVEAFRSGAVQPNRHVDPSAHFYQAVIVDRHAERIAMRNAADIYTTVYANVVRPSTSDVARYRFRVPENADGKRLQLRAALNWRKFNRTFTEFVFEGKDVPDLPITTIEESSLELQVSHTTSAPSMQHAADDWKRYNDYGIGLFLDDDTRGALAMFEMVSSLQPQLFDGWLNQARTYLADGSLLKAEQMLREASERATDQPRIAFFWGQLLERSGRLEEAVAAYRATLLAYPKSRDAWSRLGRVYWLMGRIEESVDAYMEVLEIDPEHAQSYHQLALAFKALAAREQDQAAERKYAHAAAEADKAFQKYKLDENAPKVTQRYRERHEHDNRMSQPIVIHAQEGL